MCTPLRPPIHPILSLTTTHTASHSTIPILLNTSKASTPPNISISIHSRVYYGGPGTYSYPPSLQDYGDYPSPPPLQHTQRSGDFRPLDGISIPSNGLSSEFDLVGEGPRAHKVNPHTSLTSKSSHSGSGEREGERSRVNGNGVGLHSAVSLRSSGIGFPPQNDGSDEGDSQLPYARPSSLQNSVRDSMRERKDSYESDTNSFYSLSPSLAPHNADPSSATVVGRSPLPNNGQGQGYNQTYNPNHNHNHNHNNRSGRSSFGSQYRDSQQQNNNHPPSAFYNSPQAIPLSMVPVSGGPGPGHYVHPSLSLSTKSGTSNSNRSPSPTSTAFSLSISGRKSSESVRIKKHYENSNRSFSFGSEHQATYQRPSDLTIYSSSNGTVGGGGDRASRHSASSSRRSTGTIPPPPSSVGGHGGGGGGKRNPIIYPALLSRVGEAFRARIVLSDRTKEGLGYKDAFDGREAVDRICGIIKTTDRNLALLLGRALDAQKLFHDVTYEHRLRDSTHEIYQFRDFYDDDLTSEGLGIGDGEGEGMGGPSGVFTLLTDCYSPTCTRDRLCYSISCPRRLEQQARLNLKPKPILTQRAVENEWGDLRVGSEPGTLWVHSVPQEIVDSVTETEKKRQEAINELIYTERDFVRDMEYLKESWIKPLRTSNVIAETEREDFITQVFWNISEIHAVNARFSDALNTRQKLAPIVESIADIVLEFTPRFGPFVNYGSHQLYGKYEFEKMKSSNLAFSRFVDEVERLPESRKLELNGYLTKPTTRLARYPLLLEAILKHTSDDNPDKLNIPKVVKQIREILTMLNAESGKTENRFNLQQLDSQLVFKNGEAVDLKLKEDGRELVFKGPLKKKGGQGEAAELQVFLFDHALLMVKQRNSTKSEQYKVYRK
ncbi:hypothetical protein BT69DRAFT_1301626, partial [Atractiella rhizophila]